MFTVVVPLYNKEISIRRTIHSVLAQSYTDFELLVVNDGSTDRSLEIVFSIDDPRIRVIDKLNGGVSSARNRGIEEASFSWIAFLDGDDLWKLNHLEILKQLIQQYPDDKVFCTSFVKSNQPVGNNIIRNNIYVISDYFVEAVKGHFFWTSVACIKSSVFKDVGMFDINLNRGEDLELWARIGRKYRFVRSSTITAIYRLDAENRSDKINYNINKSYLSLINLSEKGIRPSDLYYRKKLLVRAIKRFAQERRFKDLFYVIKKLLRKR